ncbi:POK19 protein, partial [Sylvia borin]|nr:POK19 protein [Sylvia borin]
AFAVLGIPAQIKTDSGPVYISQRVANFLALWGVTHKTWIPHSSTSQAIIERVHTS